MCVLLFEGAFICVHIFARVCFIHACLCVNFSLFNCLCICNYLHVRIHSSVRVGKYVRPESRAHPQEQVRVRIEGGTGTGEWRGGG